MNLFAVQIQGMLIMIGQLNESFMFYPELPRGAELTLLTIYFVPFFVNFIRLSHSFLVCIAYYHYIFYIPAFSTFYAPPICYREHG